MAEYRERQNVQIKKQSVYLKQSQVLGKDFWPKNLYRIRNDFAYLKVHKIENLNSQLLQDLDTDPNFSRSKMRPAMHATLRTGSIEAAIIIGGSNAGQLADCCTALGPKL
jgi:hypothetical protein